MRREVITVAGLLGSGKSSTSNRVAQVLGYRRFSAGDFQRTAAESLGLTYEKYQKVAEEDSQYDRKADDALIEAGRQEKIVIDSRLGYHFLPDSFKVFLTLPREVAAGRILKDAEVNPNRHKETTHGAKDVVSIVEAIEERQKSEQRRYEKYYGLKNIFDTENFDLVIDTGMFSLEEVAQQIVTAYKAWLVN